MDIILILLLLWIGTAVSRTAGILEKMEDRAKGIRKD
jgi:hypothetical protein